MKDSFDLQRIEWCLRLALKRKEVAQCSKRDIWTDLMKASGMELAKKWRTGLAPCANQCEHRLAIRPAGMFYMWCYLREKHGPAYEVPVWLTPRA